MGLKQDACKVLNFWCDRPLIWRCSAAGGSGPPPLHDSVENRVQSPPKFGNLGGHTALIGLTDSSPYSATFWLLPSLHQLHDPGFLTIRVLALAKLPVVEPARNTP